MSTVIPASTIAAVLAGCAAVGLDTDALLAQVGLERHQLEQPDALLSNLLYHRLWDIAAAADPRPGFPARIGFATPFGAFGPLDHLLGSAATVGAAFHTLSVFFRLVSTTLRIEAEHMSDDWVWIGKQPTATSDRISDEWTLALIVHRFTALADGFAVTEVWLTHSNTGPAAQYADIFGVPVQLGQARAGLHLAPGAWQREVRTANVALHTRLRSLATRSDVQQFTADPLRYLVHIHLPAALRQGQGSIEAMAAQLRLPLRTFQRRLAEEHVTWTEVLDGARKDEAVRMLRRGDTSMADIAYALGYTEQSSFNRAFKRWVGLSPRAWLRQQRPG